MKFSSVVALSLLCFFSAAEACRCDLNGASFEHLAKYGTLVVQGIVESHAAPKGSIRVKVSRVLRGSLAQPNEPMRGALGAGRR